MKIQFCHADSRPKMRVPVFAAETAGSPPCPSARPARAPRATRRLPQLVVPVERSGASVTRPRDDASAGLKGDPNLLAKAVDDRRVAIEAAAIRDWSLTIGSAPKFIGESISDADGSPSSVCSM